MTQLLTKEDLQQACDLLLAGQVVAFPTDTVYGVGVRYDSLSAVNRMRQAKGRDPHKPFPLMVADISQMDTVAYTDARVAAVAAHFMPGALTLVLKKKDVISDESVNGVSTVAIRIPDDDFVLALLRKTGPLFVTSANLSDHPAANTTEEVLAQLDGRIAAVVAGQAKSHVASTIIDCTGEKLVCLRAGQLSLETIEKEIEK
jgi:L-threonylcarbamoyladenylate synthase